MAEHFIEDDTAERGVREAVSYGDGRANVTLTLPLTPTLTLTRCPRGRL